MYTLDDLIEDVHQDFNLILEQADFGTFEKDEDAESFVKTVEEVRANIKGIVRGLAVGRLTDECDKNGKDTTSMFDPKEAQDFVMGFIVGCFDKEVLNKISSIIEQKNRGQF